MSDTKPKKTRVWTVDEAKINLPHILELAEKDGPQYIGVPQRPFKITRAEPIEDPAPPPMPLGKWLIENMPRGVELEIPADSRKSSRPIPFIDDDDGEI